MKRAVTQRPGTCSSSAQPAAEHQLPAVVWESCPAVCGTAAPAPGQLPHLLLNFNGRALRCLQVLHQHRVLQEPSCGSRQSGKQRVLQLLQPDLELVLALGEVCLQHQHPETHTSLRDETLPPVTMSFMVSPKCLSKKRVDVAQPWTSYCLQGESASMPTAVPGSSGQWWTCSCLCRYELCLAVLQLWISNSELTELRSCCSLPAKPPQSLWAAFCYHLSSSWVLTFRVSRSGRSLATTAASSWSSSPSRVTKKLIRVH